VGVSWQDNPFTHPPQPFVQEMMAWKKAREEEIKKIEGKK
jgi:hypothetical protein